MMGRIHRSIESVVDQFVLLCNSRLEEVGLKNRVWVVKDDVDSMINIGDPDKVSDARDYGFSMPYETVLSDFNSAYDEFNFKLGHYMRVAQSMGKFSAFRPTQNKDS